MVNNYCLMTQTVCRQPTSDTPERVMMRTGMKLLSHGNV